MQPVRRVIVVTNTWHMPRAQSIFEHVLRLPLYDDNELSQRSTYNTHRDMPISSMGTSGKRDNRPTNTALELIFESVPSGVEDVEVLRAREDKERASED